MQQKEYNRKRRIACEVIKVKGREEKITEEKRISMNAFWWTF
jgi:hypothetical protein